MYLSIIIPCYNEEARIGKTLDRINVFMRGKAYEWEVLVVDNGSTDGTLRVVKEMQKDMPHLKIMSSNSHGKGWAVKEGMLAASGGYRLFTDADNSTDIAQLDKLIGFVEQGYDVVISSRRIEGAVITHKQPFFRRCLGGVFAFIVRFIVPLGLRDTQNGFKLFSRDAVEKIFPQQTIFYWAFDVEILALAQVFGLKIKEVPIVWVNDDRSGMNVKGMLRMLIEVMFIQLHLVTRNYKKKTRKDLDKEESAQ